MKVLTGNQRFAVSIFVTILVVLGMYSTGYADITPVSERTPQVRDAIVAAAGVNSAADVTEAHLAAILSLRLHNKSITTLKEGDFDGLTSLIQFSMYNNPFSSLPEGIFSGLTSLTRIDLGGNQISSLPADVFSGLSSLTTLILSANKLSSLPAGLFTGLSSLRYIYLWQNQLIILPAGLFTGLSSLTVIDFKSNQISSLPADVFSGLSSLTTIRLGSNQLSILPAGLFSGLSSLTTIELEWNQLNNLSAGLFTGLSSLTTIGLGGNRLSNLPTGLFSGLSSLVSISLYRNQLSSLPEGIFSGLSSLTTLYLSDNAAELSLIIELQQVGVNQFKAVIATGAPFTIVVPLNVTNGSIMGGATTATIPIGSVESAPFTVIPTPGTSDAVTLLIGTLPNLPSDHIGYTLAPFNLAPEFVEGPSTTRTVAEDIHTGGYIGTAVTATDPYNDPLTYTLSGADASSFAIDATTGQLRTSIQLDYETRSTYTVIVNVTDGTLTSSITVTINVTDVEPEALNVGEPRTVRLFYLLPNDRPYRAEVVQEMKTGILEVQSFYAEQMAAHGHGNTTFNIETDAQGDPIVHRIDADYGDSHYVNRGYTEGEIARAFDASIIISVVVMDISSYPIKGQGTGNKSSGWLIMYEDWDWFTAAHELGHAFGLHHDFRDNTDIVSYGNPDRSTATLSACAAEFLSVHPYFDSSIPLEIETPPTVKLVSSTTYPTGAESVTIQVRVRDDSGLHQVMLFVRPNNPFRGSTPELKMWQKLDGETDTVVEFNFDGRVPSDSDKTDPETHRTLANTNQHEISVIAVDTEGDWFRSDFTLRVGVVQEITVPLSERTPQVRDAIIAAVPDANSSSDVVAADLAEITSLSLINKNITSLKAGDFDGLSALQNLNLSSNSLTTLPEGIFDGLSTLRGLYLGNNSLTTLPEGIFDGLSALQTLSLGNNSLTTLPEGMFDGLSALVYLYLSSNSLNTLPEGIFDGPSTLIGLHLSSNSLNPLPEGIFDGLSTLRELSLDYQVSLDRVSVETMPLIISLEKVGDDQFKAVVPNGAPFEIVLPITVTNGSISGGTTTLTIPAGSVESETLTVTRTAGTTADVTVDIGTLPSLPSDHSGYALVKSTDLPITVIVDESVLTLTVGAGPGAALRGYNQHSAPEWDFGSFSPQSFELNGVSYTMYKLTYSVAGKRLALQTIPHLPGGFALHLDAQQFTSVTALDYNQYTWNNVELDWSDGKTVQIGFITTPPMPPGPPTNLQATPGYEKVTLSWIPPANADSIALPITEYEYRISVDGGNTWDPDWETIGLGRTGHNTLTSCTFGDRNNNRNVDNLIDINLTNGTSYTFEIRARGGDGYSEAARITVVPDGSTPVSERTPQVRDAIMAAVPGVNSAADVTEAHLAAITTLRINAPPNQAVRPINLKIGDFSGLTTLTTLEMDRWDGVSLPDGIFEGLNALEKVSLYNSGLTSIPDSVLGLTSLKSLNLGYHRITSIPAGSFDQLTQLNTLILDAAASANTFTSLPDGVFDKLTSLTRLNLDQNNITSLPDGVFDKLTSLESLNLDLIHSLSSLPADVFDQLTSLTSLSLQGLKPAFLTDGIFSGLSSLTFLDLSGGQLTNLPTSIFSGLSSLTSLYLGRNAVDPLPLTVSLETVGEGQFKAVAPTSAPFEMVLPLNVTDGSISGGATTLTITAGSVESDVLTVTRTPGTSGAVSVWIGSLPNLPAQHTGYRLANATTEFNRLKIFDDISEQVWSGTITVGSWGNAFGNGNATGFGYSQRDNAGSISNATFTYRGTTYTINGFGFVKVGNNIVNTYVLTISPGFPACDKKFLKFGSFQLADAYGSAYHTYNWRGRWAIWAPIGQQWSYSLTLHPTAPDAPVVTAINEGNRVMLSWETPCDGGKDITRHEYRQKTRDGAFGSWISIPNSAAGGVNVASYTLTGVNNPQDVVYEVRAVNELGEGLASAPVSSSDRTPQVAEAILGVVRLNDPNVSSFTDITDSHLAGITSLYLNGRNITSLISGDFDGLTSLEELRLYGNQISSLPSDIFDGLSALETLNLYNNQLSSLPDRLFEGLTSLTTLRLNGNAVTPIPLTVSLEKVGTDQFKAVAPAGAPFDIVLPISVINGRIKEGSSSLTIPKGSVESGTLTVTRNASTTANVTVNIGTLPSLPQNHYGYSLVKSTDLPLSYPLPEVRALIGNRTQQVQDAIIAVVPGVNSAADVTEAHLAAITQLFLSNKGITSLKSGDFDGLTALTELYLSYNALSNLPVGVFDGLTALTELYLSHSGLSSLSVGVFDGLTALTILDLWGNGLSSLPVGVFDGLTALSSIDLSGNGLSSLPAGVFDRLTALTELSLNNNGLSSLPAGVFDGLTALTTLSLGHNTVNLLPLTVSLQKVADGQFKAVAPAGAPFELVLPLTVTNGSINSGATSLTIPAGSVESDTLTVIRTAGTTTAVTVDIGTLPSLPSGHTGYELVKSADLPLAVIGATAPQVTGINIPDANLRAKIESALSKTAGDPITATEMATLTTLSAQDASITDLTGLETATNLARLHLWSNNITDISAVADLTNLTHLSLHENSISDISDVANLTNLIHLRIGDNTITDISAVRNLTQLTWLDAPNNTISDISDVTSLNSLTSLTLNNNAISDISALTGLTNLIEVVLDDNVITDLSPLLSNTGFDANSEIYITGNPLSYPSIWTHIPALQARSVYVDFDNRVATAPVKISGDTQQGNTGTALAQPFVVEVRDGSSVAFAGVPVTFAVTAGGGTLSATNTTTDVNGRAQSTLTLGNTAGTNTVSVSVTGITQANTFTATATAPVVVYITPVGDRTSQVAEAILGVVRLDYPSVSSYAGITTTHLAAPTALYLNNKSITALKSGDFDGLTGLEELRLNNNQLTSLSSDIFSGLTSLSNLNLFNNQLSSLPDGIFEGLTSLTTIRLGRNTVKPLPVTVSLEKVAEGQFKVIVPTGALFAVTLPISVTNGSITGGVSSVTIPKGGVESETLTVTRTAGTTADVTVDIGTLPSLPRNHYGYALVKSDDLPLAVITGINTAPVFTDGTAVTRSIAENTAAAVNIGTPIIATDVNSDTLTYTLSGTDASSFDIDSSTGQLKTKDALDYETKNAYTVTITVSDGSLTDTITVTINVTDINEVVTVDPPTTPDPLTTNTAPEFTDGSSTTRSVAENITSSANIGTVVAATDANNDTLTYSLGGTDAVSFGIDTATGQIKTLAALDFETKTSYTVTISVSDGNGGTDSITVTINITDVNEQQTSTTRYNVGDDITTLPNGFWTPDRTANGTSFSLVGGQVTITFSNNGLIEEGDITYTCVAAGGCEIVNGQVTQGTIEATTGDAVTPVTPPPTVTNSAPVFSEGTTATRSVAENTASAQNIGTAVAATDVDGHTLTYTLSGTDASAFDIDSSTGQLKTKAALDYETKDTYTVTITVSDVSLTDTITVTINVTDINEAVTVDPPTTPDPPTTNTAPGFLEGDSTTRVVLENTPAGVNIGQPVAATDTVGDQLVYTLGGVDADSFDIESNGQLKTKAPLDYETKRVYSVTITVDDEELSDTITVIISVIDVNDTVIVSGFISVADRTPQVRDAIVAAVPNVTDAASVTESQVAAITSLDLRSKGISSLKTGDFSGLTALTNLNLFRNQLSSLPPGIFTGLTALTTLRLGGNAVDPLPLIVSLQSVGVGEFQAVITTGAPFSIILPINITNGSISGGTTSVTIPQGSAESASFTVIGTFAKVSFGSLPGLPSNHFGYTLAQSTVCNRTAAVEDAIAKAVGVSDCSDVTEVDLAMITRLDLSGFFHHLSQIRRFLWYVLAYNAPFGQ